MGNDESTTGPGGPWRPQQSPPPQQWGPSGPPTGATDLTWIRSTAPAQSPGGQQQWGAPPAQQQWAAGPGPQQWSSPSGPPPGAPRSSGRGTLIAVVVAAVVVLTVGAGLAVFLWPDSAAPTSTTASSQQQESGKVGPQGGGSDFDDDAAVAPSAAATTSASRTTSAPATSSAPTPAEIEADALTQLDELRRESLAGLSLDGRWVAQVASKSVGITDPLQTAANGTHTFYAADILTEATQLQGYLSSTHVLLLQSVDFGKYSVDAAGQPYWVTIADAGFAGADDVTAWCARTFPQLDAQQLANACTARTLDPSHP